MTMAELLVIHTPFRELAAKAAVLKVKEITIKGKSHNLIFSDGSGLKISFNNWDKIISVLDRGDVAILEVTQNG